MFILAAKQQKMSTISSFVPAVSVSTTTEDRGTAILALLRPVFADKGFDGASMQDLARAAGMSVGNFYRYFPSKAAIVAGMVGLDLHDIEQDFAKIHTHPDPMVGLRQTIRDRVLEEDCVEDGKLWAEITAAALRKPEIGAAASQMEAVVSQHLTAVFARATRRTPADAAQRYGAHAALIVMLFKASAMRHNPTDPNSDALTQLVLHTIERTLDDISADAVKG